MKSKFLQVRKMLLVAAGLLVGASAWADTKILYPAGGVDPTSTDVWKWQSGCSLISGDGYVAFTSPSGQNGPRGFYLKFYETGSDIYNTYDTYTVSFDFSNGNSWSQNSSSEAELVMFSEGASWPSGLNASFASANTTKKNYLLYLYGSGTWIQNFNINGDTEENNQVKFGNTKQWYTVSITITKSTGNVSYIITKQGENTPLTNGSGSYTASSDETNLNCQGLYFTLGRGGYETKIGNVKVTTEVTGDVAGAPTLALTGFEGASRIFQIKCEEGETIHYQIKEADEIKQSGEGTALVSRLQSLFPQDRSWLHTLQKELRPRIIQKLK